MARLDVHPMLDSGSLVVDVQANLLDGLATRLVIPLIQDDVADTTKGPFTPVVLIDGTDYLLMPHWLSVVPVSQLGQKIATLDQHHDRIVRAMDFVFHGF